jgi:predicted DNA-binding transcriptional regulator YafY
VRTVDPVGLVHAGGRWYLLATHRGADRTYRVSRMTAATVLDEPAAVRPPESLAQLWEDRRQRFRADRAGYRAVVRVRPGARDGVAGAALAASADAADPDRLELTFADRAHAVGVLWSRVPDVTVLAPGELRAEFADRVTAALAALRGSGDEFRGPGESEPA